MDSTASYNIKSKTLQHRYSKTLAFVEKTLAPRATILDLGIANPLSELMKERGYQVINTSGVDLDDSQDEVTNISADAVTAFEIFEHLVNPYTVLKKIQAKRLFASVPLSLWFAKAYRHPTNHWDRHYHEFEDWQFDWLLDKAGWEIMRTEKWTSPLTQFGIRPILRTLTPRYYIVEAKRKE